MQSPHQPHALRPGARRRAAAMPFSVVLAALLVLLGGWATPVPAQEEFPTGRITGSIEGADEGADFSGTKVVLMQFKVNEKGVPNSDPVQVQEATAEGSYTFEDVPVDPDAVYQIGARFNGRMMGSDPFTFPDGKREVRLDLRLPQLTSDASGVRIAEALLAVEPKRGAVWLTEVLHIDNPTGNVIEGVRSPLELRLPAGAERVEVLRQDLEEADHKRAGAKLLLYGNLSPGRSTLAFRYLLSVPLGTVSLEKAYPYPVRTITVLVPEGNLTMLSDRFNPRDPQDIQGMRYDAWVTNDVAATQPIEVRMSGVPSQQEYFLIPIAGFLVLMAGVVVFFLRRAKRGDDAEA